MKAVNLNIIKNLINEFPIGASTLVSYRGVNNEEYFTLIATDKNSRSTSPVKNRDGYTLSYKDVLNEAPQTPPPSYQMSSTSMIYKSTDPFTLSLDYYIKLLNNERYTGFYDPKDSCIAKHVNGNILINIKDSLFSKKGPLTFNLNQEYLYLFVRCMPKSSEDLSGLIMNLGTSDIYMIKERGKDDAITSLGFIIKLGDRYKIHDYKYGWNSQYTNSFIRYFCNKRLFDKHVFDNSRFNYSLQYSLLYITNNNLLDKYELSVVDI